MAKEPKGELARYAYGFSDKKPGLAWWIIHGVMAGFVAYKMVSIWP